MQVQKAKPGYKKVKSLFGKFEEIPEDWELRDLGSITTLLTNGFVGKATENYTTSEKGVRYVQGYNVEKNSFNFRGMKYVTHQFNEQHPKSCLKLGDLLTIQTGDVGTTTIVPDELVGANCHALIISRFKKEIANPHYFIQYFNSKNCQRLFNTIEIGTVMKHLNGGDMKKLKFLVPSIEEQQKIAYILSNVDVLINQTQKFIEQTQKLKQGLMQKLLTKGIGHKKFKKVKWLFGKEIEIPEGWKIEKLVDIVDILDSKRIPIEESEREKRHGKYPYYGASGIIDYIDEYIFDETLLCLAEDGENLRSRALPIVFTIKGKTWVNNHAHVLRVKEKTGHYFLEYFLNHLSFLKYVASTAQPKLNQKDMRSIPIISPPKEEQQKIAFILSHVDSRTQHLKQDKSHLESLKKGLMQKLLTGQIRVSVSV